MTIRTHKTVQVGWTEFLIATDQLEPSDELVESEQEWTVLGRSVQVEPAVLLVPMRITGGVGLHEEFTAHVRIRPDRPSPRTGSRQPRDGDA